MSSSRLERSKFLNGRGGLWAGIGLGHEEEMRMFFSERGLLWPRPMYSTDAPARAVFSNRDNNPRTPIWRVARTRAVVAPVTTDRIHSDDGRGRRHLSLWHCLCCLYRRTNHSSDRIRRIQVNKQNTALQATRFSSQILTVTTVTRF